MESSHLVIFSTSGKFITKFNVLRCISLSETLFWTGARGRIPITLNQVTLPVRNSTQISYGLSYKVRSTFKAKFGTTESIILILDISPPLYTSRLVATL